ncbi:MAG: glycosyltransferase [Ilumatobacteraceae bacterium]
MIRYASEFDHSGYAVAARRYIRALLAAGVPLQWEPLANTNDGRVLTERELAVHSELGDLARATAVGRDTVADVTLAHCMPKSWQRVFDELPARRRIGQTVWETDTIPTPWHREVAAADELWVPTRWNADAFRAAGWERPIAVVPHIVDATIAAPPPIDLPDDVTVFVSINAWETRKRPDLTIEAFLQAFTADDPVVLVVKTGAAVVSWFTRSPMERHTWWQTMELVKRHPHAPAVQLETDVWTDAEVAGLVERADAYVTLTAAEGWGIGAFDAATRDVPVVITGGGGQREWLSDDAPFVVPYTLEPAIHPDRDLFEPGMQWARADVGAAAEMLRAIHEDRAAARRASAPMADRLRRDYSPAAVGALMREVLG